MEKRSEEMESKERYGLYGGEWADRPSISNGGDMVASRRGNNAGVKVSQGAAGVPEEAKL